MNIKDPNHQLKPKDPFANFANEVKPINTQPKLQNNRTHYGNDDEDASFTLRSQKAT